MALVEELSDKITRMLMLVIEPAIKEAVQSCIVGQKPQTEETISGQRPKSNRLSGVKKRTRIRKKKRSALANFSDKDARNAGIVAVVERLGKADIDVVAKKTGLDRRGIGSSLHHLSVAGKLNKGKNGFYTMPKK